MSEQQKTRVITLEELRAMPEAEQQALLNHPMAKMEGTAVVRKADGTIRYAENADPGDYHEKGEGNG